MTSNNKILPKFQCLDIPVDKIPLKLLHNDTEIVKNTLLSTIPVLPKEYEISFDFKATKWPSGWTSILHFSKQADSGWGNRIPAILTYSGKVFISNAIDGNANWNFYGLRFELNTWVNFRLSQRLEGHKYMYRVYLDGYLMKEKINRRAEDFHQVDIWIGDNSRIAQPGFIKNLYISGKYKVLFSVAFYCKLKL